MQSFVEASGVADQGRCNYCHVEDRASDEKMQKVIARNMIIMVREINARFPEVVLADVEARLRDEAAQRWSTAFQRRLPGEHLPQRQTRPRRQPTSRTRLASGRPCCRN